MRAQSWAEPWKIKVALRISVFDPHASGSRRLDEAHDPRSEHPFKGNVDLGKLHELVEHVGEARVPYVSIAATVNMAGGQPISLANLREVREYTKQRGIRIILDATRAVENASRRCSMIFGSRPRWMYQCFDGSSKGPFKMGWPTS